jgi:hypothetical protein
MNECNICYEVYDNNSCLIWLPCFHFLCNECYKKLTNNICPFCRQGYPVDPDRRQGYPVASSARGQSPDPDRRQSFSTDQNGHELHEQEDHELQHISYSLPNRQIDIMYDYDILENEHYLQRNRNRNRNNQERSRRNDLNIQNGNQRRRRRNVISFTNDFHYEIISHITNYENIENIENTNNETGIFTLENISENTEEEGFVGCQGPYDDRLLQKTSQNRNNRWNSLNNQRSRYNFR